MDEIQKLYNDHISGDYESQALHLRYAKLSPAEIDKLINIAIVDAEEEMEKKVNVFLYLALYSHQCGENLPKKLYDYLLESDVFDFGQIFLRGSSETGSELIKKIEKSPCDDKHALHRKVAALAAIRRQDVWEFLLKSSQAPMPNWAKAQYMPPMAYVNFYGLHINDDGSVEQLYSDKVTPLKIDTKTSKEADSPMFHLHECCQFCGTPLLVMVETSVKFATCLQCSVFQTIWTKDILVNESIWHDKNEKSEILASILKGATPISADHFRNYVHTLAEKKFTPINENRHAFWVANEFSSPSHTQIGGMPMPVNMVVYPECPDCGGIMHFIAQVDMEEVEEDNEGVYYFFRCEKCKVNACNYDQS